MDESTLQCEITIGNNERCPNTECQLYRPWGWRYWMCWQHYNMANKIDDQQLRRTRQVYDGY